MSLKHKDLWGCVERLLYITSLRRQGAFSARPSFVGVSRLQPEVNLPIHCIWIKWAQLSFPQQSVILLPTLNQVNSRMSLEQLTLETLIQIVELVRPPPRISQRKLTHPFSSKVPRQSQLANCYTSRGSNKLFKSLSVNALRRRGRIQRGIHHGCDQRKWSNGCLILIINSHLMYGISLLITGQVNISPISKKVF